MKTQRAWAVRAIRALTSAALLAISCLGCTPQIQTQRAITWEPTQGPSGGRINVLAIDSNNPNTIYSGSEGGVYVSRDGGTSWQSTSIEQGIRTLVLDPSAPHIVYAGTDDGVYRSTDSGQTWSQASTGLPPGTVFALAVNPADTATLYAGTVVNVCKSTDSGNSWQTSGEGLPEESIWALAVDYITPQVLYAGADSGVYKSSDGGETWQRASNGLASKLRVQAIAIHPSLPSVLYAATEAGVYRSTDAAVTWQPTTDGIGNNIIHSLAIDPNNSSVLYAGVSTDGVWKSTDSAETWIPASDHIADEVVLALAIHPHNSRLIYAGTGRGIYYSSTAGAEWRLSNEGLTNTSVLALVQVPSQPGHLYATTGLGVYRTGDGGQTWSVISWGLVRPTILALAVDPAMPEALYAGTWYSEIYRSTDSGQTWHVVNVGLAHDAPINDLVVQHAAVTRDSPGLGILYAGTNGAGVFRSTDGGSEWTAINDGLQDLRVQVLELAPTPQGTLYAGTTSGIYRLDLSRPSAELSWQPAQQGLPPGEVSSVVADRHSPHVLYAAAVTGIGEIYRSTDGGSMWTAVGHGSLPTNIKVQSLALNSVSTKAHILYAGTNGGIFRSTDGGTTWRAINDGLPPRADVLGLAVDTHARLYADVANHGVYSSTDPTTNQAWLLIIGGLLGLAGLVGILYAARWASRSSGRAQNQAFERNWPRWREEMQSTLRSRGQVGIDDLTAIPKALRSRALQLYMREHGDDNLVLQPNPPLLQLANVTQVQDLMQNWRVAQQNTGKPEAFEAAVSRIASQMCQLLGFALVRTGSYKYLHGYVIRAPGLRIKIPPLLPIVFQRENEGFGQEASDLHNLMNVLDVSSYLTLLVTLDAQGSQHAPAPPARRDNPLTARLGQPREPSTARRRRPNRDAAQGVVLLRFDDVLRIFSAKEPERRLVRVLLEQVDLTVVSPYVTLGPVPENMFFGRDHELKTITRSIEDRNFAVVGGRRIGKTSILTKLHHTFAASDRYHTLYLDCQAVKDYGQLNDAVEMIWQLPCTEASPECFVQAVAQLKEQHQGQVVIVLLDEVDALLGHDIENEERLFKGLRALAQEGHCRFVFCGGRTLAARLHDSGSALFNFGQTIRLGYLSPRDTGRIVLEPMQEMGIGFEDASALIQRVIDLSACHPNLVQYICQQLILEINARGDRFIQLSDLDDIETSQPFSEYFLEVMWGSASGLERLITLLALDQSRINPAGIKAALRTHDLDVPLTSIDKALSGLVFCSILSKEGDEYCFTTPAFPSILTVTQDVNALLEQTVQDARSELASR